MIPILYKSDEVDFYDNGLGALTEIYDVDVQEQRNGLFTLTATYPVSGRHYKDIEVGRIIYAKPNQNDDAQAFRIVKTDLDISGYNVAIEADHITYDLTHNIVKKVHLQGNGQNAMTHLQEATVAPHLFRFISDLQHEGDGTLQYVNPMEAIAGTQGSILQIWGGELKRDNRTVSMLSRRGRDNFTTFRLGKNINGLKYTVDMSNVVTRIIPTITHTGNGDDYFIAGDYVDSKNIDKYANIYIQNVDMGDNITIDENESDESIKAKINAKAKNWFTQSANSKVDLPQITVEIDVTSLQDSSNYQEEFKNLEAIELTDTVTVYVPEFGVNVQAVVTELHFDPMSERVTSIVVGTSKTSFTDANQNRFAGLQNAINKIRQDAVTAIVSANGKNTNYYSNKEPEHPIEGDLWFKQVGKDMYIMVFKDGHWVELVSTKTQEMIAKAVDDAIKEAQKYTDELNDKQAKEYQEFREKYDQELADAKTERDDLDKKIDEIDNDTTQKLVEAGKDRKRIEDKATQLVTDANKKAQELADDAVAVAKDEASKALQDANSALDQAKTDITDDISVAKSEAIEAGKTADGQIRKDFKETTDSLSTSITQNKKDADGKISTAQTTATQALDGLSAKVDQTTYDKKTDELDKSIASATLTAKNASVSVENYKQATDKTLASQKASIDLNSKEIKSKVSQSDFDKKTNELSTKYAEVKETADGVSVDVANYKQSNDKKVSANTSNITALSNQINLKVNKTDYDKNNQTVNTNLANLKLENDKISQSVVELQAKANAQGQVNQLFNTEFTPDLESWDVTGETWAGTKPPYRSIIHNGSNTMGFDTRDKTEKVYATMKQLIPFTTSGSDKVVSVTWEAIVYQVDQYSTVHVRSYDKDMKQLTDVNIGNWGQKSLKTWGVGKFENIQIPDNASYVLVLFSAREGFLGYLNKPMLVFEKTVGDYVQGNYNNNSRVTALEVGLDGIIGTVNDPKNGLSATAKLASDGMTVATKAQNDASSAITTAQGIQNQVTSNDGDIKNLQSTLTQTAKQVTTEIADRKSGDTAVETRMKDLVNTQITSVTKGYTSLNQQTEQSFKTQIKNVTDQLNDMGQTNLLTNTEFNPDLEGWESSSTNSGTRTPYRSYWDKTTQSITIGFNTVNGPATTYAKFKQVVQLGTTATSTGYKISLSWYANTSQVDNYNNLWIRFYDNKENKLSEMYTNWATATDKFSKQRTWTNLDVPEGATHLDVDFDAREGTLAYLAKPMLVLGPTIGSYTPGNYNNNALVESTRVQLNNLIKDQITNVKDQISTTKTQTDKQITTEINDRKNGDSSLNTQLRNYIGTQVTSVTSGYKSAIEQSASSVIASVSTPNQLFNSDFSPDLEGWNNSNNGANGKNYTFYRSYLRNGATVIGVNVPADAGSDASKYYTYFEQDVAVPGNNNGTVISMSWDVRTVTNVNYTSLWLIFKDANHNTINADLNVLKYWNSSKDAWEHKYFDNVAVPKEAKYIRISFQTREGTNTYLSRPMLTFTPKAQDYMPGSYSGMNTQTVLKLAQDNWVLGIADNAGRIISGINGDKSGTVIQGKKLVINSDTTINGKAFIDGAVMKNGSIGHAQIGNASVGSAQIINVDVGKISGNIANFITANINTLNARVLYGDTGHLGTTDTGRVINKQDNHLQLASKGFYDSTNDRAQLELLGNSDSHISDEMKGSLNYYGNPTDKGHGLGIRMKYNQILAIDEDGGSKNLYLSPYQGGQVRIVSRDMNSYYDIAAANFRVSSQRKFKSDIKPLEDGALDIVNKTNIKSYTKNGVSEIGVIADEAPSEVLSDDGKFINIYDYTSVLYKAVQELSAKVEGLENGKS